MMHCMFCQVFQKREKALVLILCDINESSRQRERERVLNTFSNDRIKRYIFPADAVVAKGGILLVCKHPFPYMKTHMQPALEEENLITDCGIRM
jgi:hypothetical protein